MTKPYDVPMLLTGNYESVEEDCACPDHDSLILFETHPEGWSNDCACPDRPSISDLRSSNDRGELYVTVPDCYVEPLSARHHLVFSPVSPNGPCVLNESAFQRWNTFSHPIYLGDESIDQELVQQRLIRPVGWKSGWQHAAPSTLTAWIHVTNACNLDCPYCYVRKSRAHMDVDIGKNAVRAVFFTASTNDFNVVKLKYAGGEASLHFGLIRELHERARRLSEQHQISLEEVVLSNGIRLQIRDVIWMKESGVKLAISVDGIGGDHDQLRPFRNGKGSFSFVERTVDEVLLPLDLKPSITITVTRVNADNVHKVVRWALERDLSISLNFYRANPLSLSRAELALEESVLIRGMEAAYKVFEELLPTRPFLNGLLDRIQTQAHSHTCGVGISYLVISHEGKVAQCQMHLGDTLGTVHDSNLIQLTSSGPIRNLSVDNKEGCRDCTFRYRCTGGCAVETFRSTGRWDIASPHCQIYKTLYPQAMRLEGLRLLKAHGYLE